MQPVSPYNFIRVLGLCQVGAVWAASDEQGRPVTVAVLAEPVAHDQRWRNAFVATVNHMALPGPDRPRYLSADFSVPTPWAAYDGTLADGPGAERIFEALGMQVRPADDGSQTVTATSAMAPAQGDPGDSDPDQSTVRLDRPNVAAPEQAVSNSPLPAAYPSTTNGDPATPTSAPPDPISGLPMSPAGRPQSPASYDVVYAPDPAHDPFSSPVRHIVPSEPKRRRTGLWVGIAVVVVMLLAAAGTLFALTRLGDDGSTPAPTPTVAAPVPLPTASPLQPGLEPPTEGDWPAWPKFAEAEPVQELTDLDGVGFTLIVPAGWTCDLGARGEGFVKYNCGDAPGENPQIGGELIVRGCPHLCDEERRSAMRRAEEAWGLQWKRGSRLSAYAETMEIDGAARYGLVLVGYWRTSVDDAVNRQVVLRMTAPAQQANELRKIANAIRDKTLF